MSTNKVSLPRRFFSWVAGWVRPPVFEGDEEKTRVARILNTVTLLVASGVGSLILLLPIIYEDYLTPFIPSVLAFAMTIVAMVIMRRGQVRAASIIVSTSLWVATVAAAAIGEGVTSQSFPAIILTVVLVGVLLGGRAALFYALLSILAGVVLLVAASYDALPPTLVVTTPVGFLVNEAVIFVMIAALLQLSNRTIQEALSRARLSEKGLLERTSELEASQRVTFAASERATPDELLDLVVNLIRDQFDLYHAQVYFVDEEQQAAVLREATGYAGRQLLQRRHQIPLDARSLVTQSIRSGEPILVEDVSASPDFLSNPLLPDTRSELVVPLTLGDRIVGVLDVQDRALARFGESTVNLFQSMSDQIAILFENSELVERITEQSDRMTIFTNQLRTAAEIARRLSAILDPERLAREVVELLQSRFGLYHAHIYLLDEETGALRMHMGSGEVGRVLQERGHSIDLDAEKSLVAQSARLQRTVLVADTTVEPDFMPNPLLPQTRSEVAVPLIVGDRLLGVLDVQDDQVGRFGQADADTFGTLAGQVAVALQNADLFERTNTLYRISSGLSAAGGEDELLRALAHPAVETGAFRATLVYFELDEAGRPNWAEVVASWQRSGVLSVPVGTRYHLPEYPLTTLWTTDPGQPQLVVDIAGDDRLNKKAKETLAQAGVQAAAIVPLVQAGRWVGVFNFEWREPHSFSEQEREVYGNLVSLASPAVAGQRLLIDLRNTADQLREVDRLKSEFLASMSHELRTPLNSIIGYTEVLLMGIDAELSADLAEDVQSIYDNSQHLLRIINDVLDLAKIEAGRLELDREDVVVDNLVQAATSSVEGLLVNKPVEFSVDVEEGLPAIWGDRVRLHQILNNLASNAIKFTEEGSISLRAFRDDGWLCLEVKDTGIGIAEDDLEMIFERFHQVDGSNAREQEGTGLGLAITRHLVQLHGGMISVESEVGKGSTFTVRLPIERSQAVAAVDSGK